MSYDPYGDLDGEKTLSGIRAGQQVFERFVLQRVLGRGGMGIVWLARDERLERDVALKFLPEVLMHDPGAMKDLKLETQRALQMSHPHVVRVFDFLVDRGLAGIAMEYLEGETLAHLKAARVQGHFEVADLVPWVTHLCEALAYAHATVGVVHRDLKPANLMLDGRGALKITDFGIARSIIDSVSRISQENGRSGSGTLVYMSPQQALGEPASVLDDIYAVGATVYDLLTGKPPFHSGELYIQLRDKVPPSMAQRREQFALSGQPIPQEWEALVAACLAKDPAQRPHNMWEIARRLRLPLPPGTEPGAAAPKADSVVRVPRPVPLAETTGRKNHRTAVLTGAGVLAGAVVTAAVFHVLQPAAERHTPAPLASSNAEIPPAAIVPPPTPPPPEPKATPALAGREATPAPPIDLETPDMPVASTGRSAVPSPEAPAFVPATPPITPFPSTPSFSYTPTPTPSPLPAAAVRGLLEGAAATSTPRKSTPAKKPGATARVARGESHNCAGMNNCKGHGGCKTGDYGCAGKNSCKGKGGCKVVNGIAVNRNRY